MNYHSLSLGRIVRYISCGVILTDVVILAVVYALTGSRTAVFGTAAAAAATVCWGIALTVVFQKKFWKKWQRTTCRKSLIWKKRHF